MQLNTAGFSKYILESKTDAKFFSHHVKSKAACLNLIMASWTASQEAEYQEAFLIFASKVDSKAAQEAILVFFFPSLWKVFVFQHVPNLHK